MKNNRKLALSDDILMAIDKPARYIGNEINSVMKESGGHTLRFAMCFPDVYEIGMSHLGIQILYDMFNKREDVWCERVYSPWPDLDKIMREQDIPLFALESQEPIKNFDFLGITIQYEMCYTNILQILELSKIPLYSCERGEDEPIVIGGGPCTYNPEPIADFFDLFYIGEGETSYDTLLDIYKTNKENGGSRSDFLLAAAGVPGIYVPSLYEVSYKDDGTIEHFTVKSQGVPSTVEKQIVMDLDHATFPEAPVVPFIKATQDRVVIEIQRGCIRGCRFCQAGMIYRPLRERDYGSLLDLAEKMLDNTGHDEISLSSLSSSDYRELPDLMDRLIEISSSRGVNISLPSLRIDAFSLSIMDKVQDVKKSSLTFAPEAGSQRMRDVINKGLSVSDILTGAGKAFRGGWNKVKLYFMLGLPTENEEDVRAIAHLCQSIAEEYYEIPKEERLGKCQITASASFFVPKPFTPFQWAPMNTKEEFLSKAYIAKEEVRAQTNGRSIRFTYHEADVTVLEGILARGDRRLSKAIEAAYRHGALYDAWNEYFKDEIWQNAFAETGIDTDFYTTRERSTDEILPWDFINTGVTKSFMIREWEKAKQAIVSPNCRMQCMGCGAKDYNGGVCYED